MRAQGRAVFIRTQSNGSRTYLLIVDNERVDGKVMQRVLFAWADSISCLPAANSTR